MDLEKGAASDEDLAEKPPRARRRNVVGGASRRRKGARMSRMGKPTLLIPEEENRTEGFKFSSEPATRAQIKNLTAIVTDYLRRDFIYKYHEVLPAEPLALALKISPRTVNTMLAEARKARTGPTASLVIDILHGMCTGKLAGVRGYRRNAQNQWLFRLVYGFDVFERDLSFRFWRDDEGNVVDEASYCKSRWDYRKIHAAFRLAYMDWSRHK